MSIATQISRITALRNRIRAKAMSLGLLTSSRDGADSINLADCTAAIESIDEVSPYMINTPGIKNVAGFKYAQIDQSAWVPAGSTPSGLVSVVTGLSSAGITQSTPRNPVSIGTVYPPTGYQGIYANELQIDADVIKPENIKAGVQMLGVTGSYDFMSMDTAHGGKFDANTPNAYFITNNGHTITFILRKLNGTPVGQSELVMSNIQWGMIEPNNIVTIFMTEDNKCNVVSVQISRNPYQTAYMGVGDIVVILNVLYCIYTSSSYFDPACIYRRLYLPASHLALGQNTIDNTVYDTLSIDLGNTVAYDIDTHNNVKSTGLQTSDIYFCDEYLYHIDLKYIPYG